jgi:hypothetical protein
VAGLGYEPAVAGRETLPPMAGSNRRWPHQSPNEEYIQMNHRCASLLATGIAIGALLTGCKGKIEQCNALIDQANASQNAFTALEAAALNKDVLAGRVKTIREANAKVKAVELKDDKLKGFQTRWVDGLEAMAAGLEEMTKLDKAADVEKVTKATEKFGQDADKMSKLIDEINQYCSGSS